MFISFSSSRFPNLFFPTFLFLLVAPLLFQFLELIKVGIPSLCFALPSSDLHVLKSHYNSFSFSASKAPNSSFHRCLSQLWNQLPHLQCIPLRKANFNFLKYRCGSLLTCAHFPTALIGIPVPHLPFQLSLWSLSCPYAMKQIHWRSSNVPAASLTPCQTSFYPHICIAFSKKSLSHAPGHSYTLPSLNPTICSLSPPLILFFHLLKYASYWASPGNTEERWSFIGESLKREETDKDAAP